MIARTLLLAALLALPAAAVLAQTIDRPAPGPTPPRSCTPPPAPPTS